MPNVSNADIMRQLTQLQEDFKVRCDVISKENVDGIKGITNKLVLIEQRLEKIDESNVIHSQKIEDLERRIEEVEAKATEDINSLINRLAAVEATLHKLQHVEVPEQIREVKQENDSLREEIESRTNRQLRRTLVFKNIPERKDDETYSEVKALLAETISNYTDITQEEVFAGIERSHREAKRQGSSRVGKRKIFCAFLNWELPQKILDQFRKRCIDDRNFDLYVDQMYGPLTTIRRNLAFQTRKTLKEQGTISSGYVAFPARLMVNTPGEVDRFGKKIYKCHTNFSDQKVER